MIKTFNYKTLVIRPSFNDQLNKPIAIYSSNDFIPGKPFKKEFFVPLNSIRGYIATTLEDNKKSMFTFRWHLN